MSDMPPPLPTSAPTPVPQDTAAPPSLWRELSSGSAGWGVRLLVNLMLAIALTGIVPILAYFIAAVDRGWSRFNGGVYPTDDLIGFLAVLAGGALLAATGWIWTRTQGRRRAVVMPIFLTVGIVTGTIVLGIVAEGNLRGEAEFVIFGMVFLAAASIILIWLEAYRRRGPKWRALHNQQDGLPDVRCPACDYRMVGLTESRCPECGASYTLDELIARQGFGPRTATREPSPVAAPALRSA